MTLEGASTTGFAQQVKITLVVWLLLLSAAVAAAAGLSASVRGLNAQPLIFISATSLLAGWGYAGWLRRAFIGIPLMMLTGLLVMVVFLSESAIQFLSAVIMLGSHVLDSSRLTLFPPQSLYPALIDLLGGFNHVNLLFIRLSNWLGAGISGTGVQDPAALNLVWGSLIWIVFGWMAWAVKRRYQTLTAVLPAMVVLSAVLAYVHREPVGLLAFLSAALLLIVFIEQVNREKHWQQIGTDYSPEIRFDMAMVVVPFCTAILLAAAIFPSFSFKRLAENIQNWMQTSNSENEVFPRSFGLYPAPPIEPAIKIEDNPGLPRSHLIGSGPELSQMVVMRITTRELSVIDYYWKVQAPTFYWRGLVYDGYTGHGWATSSTKGLIFAPDAVSSAPPPQRKLILQNVDEIEDSGNILYAAGDLVTADQRYMVAVRSQNDPFAAGIEARHYQALSNVANANEDQLRSAGTDYPDWIRQRYLRLPDDLSPRVQSLALNLTAEEQTPYDKARALETYLRTYPYNLDLPAPPEDRDIVDYFLFDLRQGYCDYYASAMVVMARIAGIPARLAVGYASGRYDSLNAAYIVTQADAHSWPELFFPQYGWVEFEPTANRSDTQAVQPEDYSPQPLSSGSGQASPGAVSKHNTAYPVLILILASVLLFALLRWAASAVRLASMSPQELIKTIYLNIIRMSEWFNIPVARGATPYEVSGAFIQGLDAQFAKPLATHRSKIPEDIRGLLDIYVSAQYSPRPLTQADAAVAKRRWNQLRRELWLLYIRNILSRKHKGKTDEQQRDH